MAVPSGRLVKDAFDMTELQETAGGDVPNQIAIPSSRRCERVAKPVYRQTGVVPNALWSAA
jgi:hypothetical protein